MSAFEKFSDIYDRTFGRITEAESCNVENGFSEETSAFAASLLEYENAEDVVNAINNRLAQATGK